jgi:hypothetical protein
MKTFFYFLLLIIITIIVSYIGYLEHTRNDKITYVINNRLDNLSNEIGNTINYNLDNFTCKIVNN